MPPRNAALYLWNRFVDRVNSFRFVPEYSSWSGIVTLCRNIDLGAFACAFALLLLLLSCVAEDCWF